MTDPEPARPSAPAGLAFPTSLGTSTADEIRRWLAAPAEEGSL